MVRRFVRFLVGEGVAKPTPEVVPADTELGRLKRAYEDYLRRQRGLSDRTIFHSWRIAHRFLTFRFGEALGDLAEISAADIAAFLQQVMTRTPPLRDKTLSSHLRNFFRYLFQAGKTTTNLATGILSVPNGTVRGCPDTSLLTKWEHFSRRFERTRRQAGATMRWCS